MSDVADKVVLIDLGPAQTSIWAFGAYEVVLESIVVTA